MKILVLDEEFPFPLNTGKRIRSYNLLSRLARDNDLCYLAYGEKNSRSCNAFHQANMNPTAVPNVIPAKSGPMFYFRLGLNLFSDKPYIVTSHYSEVFLGKLNQLIENFTPDIILCEWTPYAVFTDGLKSIKRVVVAHNVESRIWRRYYDTETNPAKKWYIGRQVKKLESFEKKVFESFDGITAVSESDATEIKSICPGANVCVVDNGVDLDYFSGGDKEIRKNRMVFVGTMDWRPNQDAVSYFVREVFPLIRERKPEAEAVFVGRNPPEFITEYDRLDGITITGSVNDIRPYVHESAIYIVPLRIGGGTRLKILDAMAMQKPIVSTLVGAEGLEVKDGHDILLADNARSLADQALRLMDDEALQSKLSSNGRKLVESKYGWDSLGCKLNEFLEEVYKK